MDAYFKSIVDMDRNTIIICDTNHTIIYMNPAAIKRYNGNHLIGKCVFDCHNSHSVEMIKKVMAWFEEDENNNMIHTFYLENKNKDLYMVALRDENKKLIGYYERHELRDKEEAPAYDFSKSLV